jgi:hypothetical protein
MQEERSTRREHGKKTAGGRGQKLPAKRPSPSREDIARRAYEIFLRRGSQPGHEAEDWLQAERELSEGRGRA